jgi:hypothetical protein
MSGDGSTLDWLKSVAGVDPPERPYVCRSCEAGLDVEYHVCPECGGFTVELRRVHSG